MHQSFFNQKGSSLIEAALACLVISGFIGSIVTVFYLSYAKLTLSDIGYRSLICAAKANPIRVCKIRAQSSARIRLPIGNLDKLTLKKRGMGQRVDLEWSIANKVRLNYKRKFHYGVGR